MIRFEKVIVRYPRSPRAALDGVSLEAVRGRITAVVGPNGSGKSTLVRTLLRLVPLDGGSILVNDVPLSSMDRRELARRVAVVTQSESITFALPAREYVALGRFPHEGRWSAEGPGDDAAIDRAMELAGVSGMSTRGTDELSGGEWQRVRIARALAQGGDALVLDEPSTFLDVGHEMAMFELFALLAREGTAVFLVSHQLNLVARFADTIVLLDRGSVAAAGTPSDVMRASVLERVYDWPLVITRDPAVGAPALLPLRRRQS
ncbi:MAG TPA: ABC transporter ATP-binding protein [Gemmatimonadaceae bacterium]